MTPDRSAWASGLRCPPLHRWARRRQARTRRWAARVAGPVTGRAGRALWRPTTGRGTGHRPPHFRAAHRSGPRMIGGRIFDDTLLVGFALGRSVYVLAAGKLACAGCAAPLRCAAGYVPPRNSWIHASPRPHPSRCRGCPGDPQRRQDHDLGVRGNLGADPCARSGFPSPSKATRC